MIESPKVTAERHDGFPSQPDQLDPDFRYTILDAQSNPLADVFVLGVAVKVVTVNGRRLEDEVPKEHWFLSDVPGAFDALEEQTIQIKHEGLTDGDSYTSKYTQYAFDSDVGKPEDWSPTPRPYQQGKSCYFEPVHQPEVPLVLELNVDGTLAGVQWFAETKELKVLPQLPAGAWKSRSDPPGEGWLSKTSR